MERIRLTKEEKKVLRHVMEKGCEQPRDLSPIIFQYSLASLQEKGMVTVRFDHEKAYSAKLSMKGKAYIEDNPSLKNPVPWKDILLITLSAVTAISTMLALFIACTSA